MIKHPEELGKIVVEGEINGGCSSSNGTRAVRVGAATNVEWASSLGDPPRFILGQRVRITLEAIETPQEAGERWRASPEGQAWEVRKREQPTCPCCMRVHP